jgi:hypothetical protein
MINSLLNENPDQRPKTAREFYTQWNTGTELISGSAIWRQIAGSLSYLRHSRKLLTAARELLYANRDEESYWLLVECLEEDPEYEDALEFMSKFPQSRKNKNKLKQIYKFSLLALSILIISLSYFAGRISLNQESAASIPSPAYQKHPSQLLTLRNSFPNTIISRLMEDTLKSTSLMGRIIIQNYPKRGTFFIDNSLIDKKPLQSGIECTYGTHVLLWKSDSGFIIWKQRINLLPFQKKCIYIK